MRKLLFLILVVVLDNSVQAQPLIVYNNSIVYRCLDTLAYRFYLGTYKGDTAVMYPNPDGNYGYLGDPVIFDNNFYFRYKISFNNQQLACFNGDSVCFVKLPDKVKYQGSPIVYQNALLGNFKHLVSDSDSVAPGINTITESGFYGSPIIVGSNLFFAYQDTAKKILLAKYNGISTTLYPNPDDGPGNCGNPVNFNNQLFFRYRNASLKFQLAKLTGTGVELILNPDNSFGVDRIPIVFKNYLYVKYSGMNGREYLAKYDGSDLSLIANPDTGTGYLSQCAPVVLSTNMYFGYRDASNKSRIAKFDGTTITLIANPDSGEYYGTIQLYNNKLYFGYIDSKNKPRLAVCDGNTISLFASPDSGMGYRDYPLVYNGKLYFMYANVADKLQLACCDGVSISLIPNTFMGSALPVPPPTDADVGPYTQSLSNIVEMKTVVLFETADEAWVYPNPVSSTLKIFSSQVPATIDIIDVSGRMVMQFTAYAQESSVTVSGFKDGVYLVSVQSAETVTVKKFIKK